VPHVRFLITIRGTRAPNVIKLVAFLRLCLMTNRPYSQLEVVRWSAGSRTGLPTTGFSLI
jgi:hypothetical protein